MTLLKNDFKLINSLRQKKYRQLNGLFIAEGVKVVKELLNSSIKAEKIFATEDFSENTSGNEILISDKDLKKISVLKTPNKVLGIFNIPKQSEINYSDFTVALDKINDPGNLGTIIRLCDWFGVKQLICSNDTVDCYNQKVVQSTMGSITRVNIVYTNLKEFINKTTVPTYIADMNGLNIYETSLPKEAVLIMGNEANGISKEISEMVANRLTIPRFGNVQKTESLNVATATSILLSEFKRGLK